MRCRRYLLIVQLFLLLTPPSQGYLVVPDLRQYTYIQSGDINLGVLQNVLPPGRGDEDCDNSSYNTYALHQCEGVLYALNEINQRQDILPNITLGIVCMDTCSLPIVALSEAVYLVPDHQICEAQENDTNSFVETKNKGIAFVPKHHEVVGVIGPGMSRITVVISSFLQAFQLPVLGTYKTSDELSDKSRYEYFLRLVPPDRLQAEVIGNIIKHFGWTYVGLIHSEGSYGEYGAKGIKQMAAKHGFCLAYIHEITLEKVSNEAEQVKNLLNNYKKARVVVWFVDHGITTRIFEVLEHTLKHKHIFLMSDSAWVLTSLFPNLCNGAIIPFFSGPSLSGFVEHEEKSFSSAKSSSEIYKYWVDILYRANFNCSIYDNACFNVSADPKWYNFQSIGSMYYEATNVLASVIHTLIIKNCPEVFQRSKFQVICLKGPELLQSLRTLETEGVTGKIAFDENGDRMAKYNLMHAYLDSEGKLNEIIVGSWDKISGNLDIQINELHWDLTEGETNQLFDNRTVPMSYCSDKCDAKQYKIQLSPRCCWECKWCRNNERLNLNKSKCLPCPVYTWPDEHSNMLCVSIPPYHIQWNGKVPMIMLSIAAIGALVSVTFFCIIWKHRNTRLIKSTNKELSVLILLSAALAFMSIIAFVYKPTKMACLLREVAFHVVVCFLYSSLLVKTLKVYAIFRSGKKGLKSSFLISLRAQRTLLGFFIMLQVIIIASMGVMYPAEALLYMPTATEPYVELTCKQHILAFLLPVSYNVVTILLCALLGYNSRKLPDNYNESAFIFVSVATTLFAWVVFLPTYFTASSSAHQAMILAICLMLNAYVTMACLFAPKIYALYYVDEATIKFSTMTQNSVVVSTVSGVTN